MTVFLNFERGGWGTVCLSLCKVSAVMITWSKLWLLEKWRSLRLFFSDNRYNTMMSITDCHLRLKIIWTNRAHFRYEFPLFDFFSFRLHFLLSFFKYCGAIKHNAVEWKVPFHEADLVLRRFSKNTPDKYKLYQKVMHYVLTADDEPTDEDLCNSFIYCW